MNVLIDPDRLMNELKRLVEASKAGDFDFLLNTSGLSREGAEIAGLINEAIGHYRTSVESDRMANEYTHIMFDTMPLACNLWNKDFQQVLFNEEAVRLYELKNSEEYCKRFFEFSPEYQPCGKVSKELTREKLIKAFETGYERFEWMHKTQDNQPLPCEITLIRIEHEGEHHIAAYKRDLREEKAAKKKIAETEEAYTASLANQNLRLNLLLSGINVGIWDMPIVPDIPVTGDSVIWYSDEFRRMLGYTGEKDFPNILKSWNDRLHPEEAEKVFTAFTSHMNDYTGQTPYDIEHRMITKNGECRWFRCFGNTLRNADGAPLRVSGATEDISEKKKAQEDLLNHNMRLDLLVSGMDVALWEKIIDPVADAAPANEEESDAQVFWWSDEYRKMLGYKDETDFPNVFGSWKNKVHPDDRERVFNVTAAHVSDITGKTPLDYEYRLMVKSGEYRWFHSFGNTLRNSEGIPLRVTGAIQDITEDKTVKDAYINQNLKLNLMLGGMNVAIWDKYFTDSNDQLDENSVFNWSDDYRHMFGYTGENDFPNIFRSVMEGLHPDDREKTLADFTAHVRDKTGNTPFDAEYRFRLKSGEYKWFRSFGATLRNDDGTPFLMSGATEDINERKTLEEASEKRTRMVYSLSKTLEAFILSNDEALDDIISNGIRPIVDELGTNCVCVYRHRDIAGHLELTYMWDRDVGGTVPLPTDKNSALLSDTQWVKDWLDDLQRGRSVNILTSAVSGEAAEYLSALDISVIFMAPIFAHGKYWGVVTLQSGTYDMLFKSDTMEKEILEVTAGLLAKTIMRAEAEQAVFKAEEHARLMLDSGPLCCQLWDRNCNIIDCNDAAIKLYGYKSKEEYMEKWVHECSPEYQPDGRLSGEAAFSFVQKAFAEGFCVFEWMQQMPGGEPLPAEVTLVRVKYKEDCIVVGYTRDLRKQKKAEHQLVEADERMRLMMDSNPFICNLWNRDGIIFDCNEAAHKLFDMNKQEYMDRFFELTLEFRPDGTRTADYARKMRETAFEKGKCVFESTLRKLDGTLIPMEVTMTRVMYKNECVLVGYGRDLREHNRMLQAAQEANKAKSEFLSRMSHEMRTPMNAIIGMTTIGKKADDTERKNHALNKIGDASNHLLGVINDVLDMSKIEAGKLELAPVEFHFEHMMQKVITIIGFRADEKHQRLSVKTDKNIPRIVEGDDQRLSQAITNLMSNAVKFTPEEGEIRLNASLAGENGDECELRIEVADNGIGISPEQQKTLFESFVQAEGGTSRQYGGTGLGLAITKRIVELMGGRIWIESETGKGAKFIFIVKVKRSATPKGNTEYDSSAFIAGEFAGKTMLLAEDIEINREILMLILEDTGLVIECAENGKEALDMIVENPDKYDVVFMDMQMPEMDGLEATRRIRTLPGHQRENLPIIAMTANVFKDDIAACKAAGMDSHVGKPLDIDKVIDTLRTYLV